MAFIGSVLFYGGIYLAFGWAGVIAVALIGAGFLLCIIAQS